MTAAIPGMSAGLRGLRLFRIKQACHSYTQSNLCSDVLHHIAASAAQQALYTQHHLPQAAEDTHAVCYTHVT
jgi:hypothetical protein